jgi:hypothetical protein
MAISGRADRPISQPNTAETRAAAVHRENAPRTLSCIDGYISSLLYKDFNTARWGPLGNGYMNHDKEGTGVSGTSRTV